MSRINCIPRWRNNTNIFNASNYWIFPLNTGMLDFLHQRLPLKINSLASPTVDLGYFCLFRFCLYLKWCFEFPCILRIPLWIISQCCFPSYFIFFDEPHFKWNLKLRRRNYAYSCPITLFLKRTPANNIQFPCWYICFCNFKFNFYSGMQNPYECCSRFSCANFVWEIQCGSTNRLDEKRSYTGVTACNFDVIGDVAASLVNDPGVTYNVAASF